VARVVLDADVVIAFLDGADDQHSRAVELLRDRLAGGDEVLVPASVYAEVLVRPLQRGTAGVVEEFLSAIQATVVTMDRELAGRAAELRARHRSLRLPDAFVLAVTLQSDAALLTYDQRLRRVVAREQG
jgi:predicted nucleic acid-binding protein